MRGAGCRNDQYEAARQPRLDNQDGDPIIELSSEGKRLVGRTIRLGAPHQTAEIFTCWAFAAAGFGMSTVRTPLVMFALMLAASTPGGKETFRSNAP